MVTFGLLLLLAFIAALVVIGGSTYGDSARREEMYGLRNREPLEPPRTDSGATRTKG